MDKKGLHEDRIRPPGFPKKSSSTQGLAAPFLRLCQSSNTNTTLAAFLLLHSFSLFFFYFSSPLSDINLGASRNSQMEPGQWKSSTTKCHVLLTLPFLLTFCSQDRINMEDNRHSESKKFVLLWFPVWRCCCVEAVTIKASPNPLLGLHFPFLRQFLHD